MPVQKAGCEALEYNNGTHLIKTGTLVTINNEIENSAIRNVRFLSNYKILFAKHTDYENAAKNLIKRDYINAINSPDESLNNPFAWIGLRKVCRDCSWHWINDEPFTYANWYGNEPDSINSECAHIRLVRQNFI